MIELTHDQQQSLRDLIRAGSAGLELGTEVCVSAALMFGLLGLATITNAKVGPQRAVATERAKVFAWRTAA